MTVTTRIARAIGLVGVIAAVLAAPVANADSGCKDVGQTIDGYLNEHPDVHQELQDKSRAEGGDGTAIDYLNRHPDVRQHLIDLSHQCLPDVPHVHRH